VLQESVFTRVGVERIIRYAFDLARTRTGRVCSATKSNGLIHSMPFWDEIFASVAAEYPDVAAEQCHVDALAARMVLQPDRIDVVVGSNLFGDILSDLAAAVTGGLGMAPSGNINPQGDYPSMFEAVHGSAPDIAGQGIANPVAQVLAGAMMLEHLGETVAAQAINATVEKVLAEGAVLTPDLGGRATTAELGTAIADALG
jgi:tartrate dehydrogenase/decarboxylase/D-malate dehydrogenase